MVGEQGARPQPAANVLCEPEPRGNSPGRCGACRCLPSRVWFAIDCAPDVRLSLFLGGITLRRLAFAFLVLLPALVAFGIARAQAPKYPAKVIRWVVPF